MAFLVQSPKMNHTATVKWPTRTRASLTSCRIFMVISSYLTDDLQVLRLTTIAFSTWIWRLYNRTSFYASVRFVESQKLQSVFCSAKFRSSDAFLRVSARASPRGRTGQWKRYLLRREVLWFLTAWVNNLNVQINLFITVAIHAFSRSWCATSQGKSLKH